MVRQAVEQALTANGAAATTAATVAAEAVAWLQKHAGSQRLWISSARTTVHDSIRAEYTGRNLDELAERYGVHPRTVRRIVCTSSRLSRSTFVDRSLKAPVVRQNDATEK
jgi:Mor family transcriptional regulator